MCVDYDTRVAKHCREPTAEEVNNKMQANFCDHFKPREGAYVAPNTAEQSKARSELEGLFGKAGGPKPADPPPAATDPARAELDKLFGKK